MGKTLENALKLRRSYYAISCHSPISDEQIADIIRFAVKYIPSAFNSQSSRIVVLLGDNHRKLWNITLDALAKVVPKDSFATTQNKIGSFAAGYGTVLYFEDQNIIKSLQDTYPLYAENFPVWSEQSSGMHQLTVWTMLEEVGFGASLQHYNEMIESDVKTSWNIDKSWKLIAQMPFGTPTAQPAEKTYEPIETRIRIFK